MIGGHGADDFRDPCERAGELLRNADRVVILTGAGISTESGIPDFRSPGGLWSRYDPSTLTFDRFRAHEQTRRLYWEIAVESYPIMRDAAPNAAHHAVVAIEQAGKLELLVTQNVDGLHRKAGSSADRTIEIHGSALRVCCIECGREHDREAVHLRVVGGDVHPPAMLVAAPSSRRRYRSGRRCPSARPPRPSRPRGAAI